MTALCCFFPFLRHVFFAGMLFFTTNDYSINIYPLPTWTGTARGYAFTAVSFCAVPLLMSMILSTKYKVRLFPPGVFFYFLYYLAILISGINAVHMHQWGFEVYKMFWMYITFLAAFNYLNNCKNLTFFAYLVCSILIILFLIGFDQKYRGGRFQIRSTFPHQNSLSLYLEPFGLLALGILMNEKMNKSTIAEKTWERLSIACGYSLKDVSDMNVSMVQKRADKEMYRIKKEMKESRKGTPANGMSAINALMQGTR